ncbi:MAG: MmgE/PrpD family protein, partial [Candidatus Puniceispirillaceae bacterium]
MANHTLKLAEFCSEITFEKLEPKVVERAKLIISDCVAAILGGIVEIEVQQLLKVRCGRKSAIRQVPIIGLRKWAEPSQAALLHGLAGTVLEMDEGHQFAKGHPGMHVFPALLAAAQSDLPQQPVSGQDFITAFVAGYDVAARIGLASQLRPLMHPHGTWGVIGAASAIGRLLQFNNQQHAQLMNIASSLTTATSRKTMLEGGTVRNVYAGLSNQMAHLAIDLIQSG